MSNNIVGYKCFNNDLTNNYNQKVEFNRIYSCSEPIKYKHCGFHFCMRLEDTLRFFDGLKEDIIICKVNVLGNVDWYDDEYYGYYDMGCTNKIYIGNPMSRKEIIEYADNLYEDNFIRFIQGFKLNHDELTYFKLKFKSNNNILKNLKYFQEGYCLAFTKHRELKK